MTPATKAIFLNSPANPTGFVATRDEIAATLDNGEGIAGVGIPVELVVAKVTDGGSISLANEANAIRWAVDQGAQVVNLSLGGPRDPKNPKRDSYSAVEQAAVEYAVAHGVVVVAAAGNCSAAACPEPYASYPAALPHVLGVGALNHTDATPLFSNRDLSKAAASILGDEAMHWAVLRHAVGEAPVPAAFVS